ncbi:hypothetical protein L228DRAFT_25735 [Xylona heveae TC161]|uniref:Uncharacterized protein n=1 Tax=Xylona heveae (strain CBS 132557 / TC161) TaxID=1328760 RepID=A0A165ADR6_XYLHT|nr:hypothetical protein L228DRAFT_25735 [Xylona heveae TC161]KZF20310.1 hypothetical protein L228DRAFT_25735 [Xylona heveae TC161]
MISHSVSSSWSRINTPTQTAQRRPQKSNSFRNSTTMPEYLASFSDYSRTDPPSPPPQPPPSPEPGPYRVLPAEQNARQYRELEQQLTAGLQLASNH